MVKVGEGFFEKRNGGWAVKHARGTKEGSSMCNCDNGQCVMHENKSRYSFSVPPETSSWEPTDDGVPIQTMKYPRNTILGASLFLESIGLTKEQIAELSEFTAKEFQELAESEYKRGAEKIADYVKDCHSNGFEMQTLVEYLENEYIVEDILEDIE